MKSHLLSLLLNDTIVMVFTLTIITALDWKLISAPQFCILLVYWINHQQFLPVFAIVLHLRNDIISHMLETFNYMIVIFTKGGNH